MINPMLAVSMDKVTITHWNQWAAEQKFDGWRLIVQVKDGDVQAWTRPRRRAGGGKTMALVQLPDCRAGELPTALATRLRRLPDGVYDGELLGGKTSTDVGTRQHQHALRFVVFDVLVDAHGDSCVQQSYDERRAYLTRITFFDTTRVSLAQSINVTSVDDVVALTKHIWSEGGEGVMLKRRSAAYQVGKRSKDLVKVKKLSTEVGRVIGFEASRGKVLARGPFATVVLEVRPGVYTSMKTVDDDELDAFNKHALKNARPLGIKGYPDAMTGDHPAMGRKLRFEYQEIAAEGGFRHPRWDRWENE